MENTTERTIRPPEMDGSATTGAEAGQSKKNPVPQKLSIWPACMVVVVVVKDVFL